LKRGKVVCHLRIGGNLKKDMKTRVLSGVVYIIDSKGPRT